jgi:hypothetical protein
VEATVTAAILKERNAEQWTHTIESVARPLLWISFDPAHVDGGRKVDTKDLTEANEWKERGNAAFAAKAFVEAIRLYTEVSNSFLLLSFSHTQTRPSVQLRQAKYWE